MLCGLWLFLSALLKKTSLPETFLPGNPCRECQEDIVFSGLIGMRDPPREEVKAAIKICEDAGIKTVMITGDHKVTAASIARELRILKKTISLLPVQNLTALKTVN